MSEAYALFTHDVSYLPVKYAISLLKQNEQITMTELKKFVLDKYSSFDITLQHLGKILRYNNVIFWYNKKEYIIKLKIEITKTF